MNTRFVDWRSTWIPSLLLVVCAGCSQPVGGPAAPPSQSLAPGQSLTPSPSLPASASASADVAPALLEKVCQAKHADSSSTVYRAFGATGEVERLVVTPSRKIADMGNLIFDMDGSFLGHDTGGEVPWGDRAFMAGERERVGKLMKGAQVPDESKPIPCK